jgi:uncharacterized protein (TIGR02996 family)
MTMQMREVLNYEGQPREILALPLTGCGRPLPEFGGMSSACHRGYHGTWEFQDDALHLVRLESPIPDDHRNRLWGMFPEAPSSAEAIWFSGKIVPDDVTDPKDTVFIEMRTNNQIPVYFVAFTAVVRLGKLLLETATDLKTGVSRSRLTRHAEEMFPGDELAFLRAIQAEPNDITAKLVYADWLEDRDDSRGPILRTQATQQEREGLPSPQIECGSRWSIPTGCVPAENIVWFWRQLAGISEPTPEELQHQEFLRRMNASS